ncbi:MAG: glycogen debranching N-terminal domain-containing protein, partial [Gaiellaceae bacterium]
MAEPTVSLLDGNTFVVSDRLGDLAAQAGRDHGFLSEDTRFLSRFSLSVDGAQLELLGFAHDHHFAAQFFLTPHVGPEDEAPYSVMRRRCVDRVWIEEITIVNHRRDTRTVHVELEVDADFADLFEVKDGAIVERELSWHTDGNALVIAYASGEFRRSVTIASDQTATISRHGFTYSPELKRGEQWTVALRITPFAAQSARSFAARSVPGSLADVRMAKTRELDRWLARAPALDAENRDIARTYRASLTDLAALRLQPDLSDPATLPAAGLPWFMALFGRDSLITSFQALPYLPTL